LVSRQVAHYIHLSLRAKHVQVSFKPKARKAVKRLAADDKGIKVYSEGE
jgi:hypothetical protein